MNNKNTPSEINESNTFNVEAAHQERLAWRLGGQLPTERALGIDESINRDVQQQIDNARIEKIQKRLGISAIEGKE